MSIIKDKTTCSKTKRGLVKRGYTKTDKKDYAKKKRDTTNWDTKKVECEYNNEKTTDYYYKAKTAATKKYKCDGSNCIEDPSGTYTEPTCGGACGGGTKKWKCNGSGPCVEDPTGTYSTKAGCEADTACSSTSTSSYTTCNGPTYKKGCKDSGATKGNPNTNGMIYKLQGCIGAYQDSFFGSKTEEALKAAFGGKAQVTDKDIESLCKSTDQGQHTTPEGNVTVGTEEYWQNLIDNEQVYGNGLIYKLKSGEYVYIIKTDLNNSDIKYPLDTLSGEDVEKYDYLVLYAVKSGKNYGLFGVLTHYVTPNGETKTKVETNPKWKWEPIEQTESFDLSEMIKRKLREKLNEQRFSGRGTSSSGANTGVNTSSGTFSGRDQGATTTGDQGATTTPTKPDPKKVKAVIEPLRLKTIELLNQIKENPKFSVFASKEDKKSLDDAITLLNNFDSSKACDSIALIDENLIFLNQMISDNEGGLGKKDIVDLAKQVRTNLEKVKSECSRLEKEAQSSSSNSTTNQGSTTTTPSGEPVGDQDLRKMFGFVGPDGKTYSPKPKIKSIERKGGELAYGTIQNAINNSDARSYYFSEYNKLIDAEGVGEEYKLRFPDNFPESEYAGQIINDDNESALYPLEDANLGSEFVKRTFGNFLGTNSKLELIVSKRQGSTMQSARQKCPYNKETIREYIVDYLYRGLTPDNRPASGEKQTLCSCYSEGMFNDFAPITKDELGAIAKNLRPFTLLDRRLSIRELTKLIQGEDVNGTRLSSAFVDRNFATKACRGLNESRLTSNVSTLLSEAIVAKRKERTRDVIVEDLLKIIKRS